MDLSLFPTLLGRHRGPSLASLHPPGPRSPFSGRAPGRCGRPLCQTPGPTGQDHTQNAQGATRPPPIAHRAWETPTHTWPPPPGAPVLERQRRGGEKAAESCGGRRPLAFRLAHTVSWPHKGSGFPLPGCAVGPCVGGGGPPSVGDTRRAGLQARQWGRPSTALGGQGQGLAGGGLRLSRPSVSPSAAGGGLDMGCPG